MKKRKFNLLLNIAVLCMCITAIAIGVYSAKTASLNVSGTIGFTAHNCKVRVLGKITGAVDADNVAITSDTSTAKINYTDPKDPSKGKLIDGTEDTWNFESIYFDDLNTDKYHEVNDIVFTFTITNESAFYVDVTVDQDCIKNNRLSIYAPNNGETLAPKDQQGSTVTLTVKLQLQKVDGEYSNLDSAINATLLKFTKSQAPSYLATDWKTKINTFNASAFSSAKKISFVNKINDTILNGFDKDGENYKTVPVGAVDEKSKAGNLTTSVTDVIAYYNSSSKEIIICSPARIYAPQSCAEMFKSCKALTILNLSNFDTSKVTKMNSMFDNCSKLTSLVLSNFDTSSVINMSKMFYYCDALTSLDVRNFDTSKVTDMNNMFYYCSGLNSLDLSNFNTSKVTDMNFMFYNCQALSSLDVRNFNTSSVKGMCYMFDNCYKLTSLDVSNFDTSSVTDMKGMFYNCNALISLDVSNFDTSNVTSMMSMFYHCDALTSLDVSKFNTSSVTIMIRMFQSCSGLTSLDVSNFDTSSVTEMSWMFQSCYKLTSLDVSKFNTSSVTDMYSMFVSCSGLTSLDLSNFDTSKVTNMSSMFSGCSGLEKIYVNSSKWSITQVTSSDSMFSKCEKLVGSAGTKYNYSNKDDKTYAKVDGGTSDPGYFTEKQQQTV